MNGLGRFLPLLERQFCTLSFEHLITVALQKNPCQRAEIRLVFCDEYRLRSSLDVIGGWRSIDESCKPVDASGSTLSGAKIEGLAGLRSALLAQPEQFPRTVTGKLMAYALGRKLEYYDQPSVRRIVSDAAARDYCWSEIIL